MIRPHHYAWPKMWPIPTDVSWSVSQSVCFCVRHDSELSEVQFGTWACGGPGHLSPDHCTGSGTFGAYLVMPRFAHSRYAHPYSRGSTHVAM